MELAGMIKTRKFLIVSHGRLAGGLKSTLELIVGYVELVQVLEAYEEANKSIEKELAELFAEERTEWVVFTDLLGGSITNQVLREINGRDIHVVAGVNLPLVIEVVLSDPGVPIGQVLEEAIGRAKEQLVYVNPLLTQSQANA